MKNNNNFKMDDKLEKNLNIEVINITDLIKEVDKLRQYIFYIFVCLSLILIIITIIIIFLI